MSARLCFVCLLICQSPVCNLSQSVLPLVFVSPLFFLFICLSMSICLSSYMSARLSVFLFYVCKSISLPFLSSSLSALMSSCLSVCFPVFAYMSLSIYKSIYQYLTSICMSICLSEICHVISCLYPRQ